MADTPNWFEQGSNSIWYPYTQMQTMTDPIKVVGTKGCKLLLDDGRELIDGIASWWSACHGYNHPHIQRAILKQLEQMPHVMFAGVAHEQAYTLSARLSTMSGMDKVFFTDSGSTAVETAMKMAVQYWQNQGEKRRNKFVCFTHGYHGDTMGAMSLCDPEHGMHKTMNNYMPKQYNLSIPSDEYGFAEFDTLLGDIKNTVAAVIIEPLVQGAGGFKFHSADTLAEIYRITKKHKLLFIADEVMTGFGRTGSLFACQEAAITPDIMCLGKALTGGTLTLAATLARQHIFDAFLNDQLEYALMSGPTFMANPLACAAANASLDLFDNENRLAQVETIEQQLYHELTPCHTLPNVIDVRVKGAIGVVQLTTSWPEIFRLRQQCIQHGVWLRPFGDVIYILPPLIISKDELSQLTAVLIKVLQEQ